MTLTPTARHLASWPVRHSSTPHTVVVNCDGMTDTVCSVQLVHADRRSCLQPVYSVQDADCQTVLTIRGPACICPGPCDVGDQDFVVGHPLLSSNNTCCLSATVEGIMRRLLFVRVYVCVCVCVCVCVKRTTQQVSNGFEWDFLRRRVMRDTNKKIRFWKAPKDTDLRRLILILMCVHTVWCSKIRKMSLG